MSLIPQITVLSLGRKPVIDYLRTRLQNNISEISSDDFERIGKVVVVDSGDAELTTKGYKIEPESSGLITLKIAKN